MSATTGTLWWLPRILADQTLDPTETLLLVGLADHVNDEDRCFVGIQRLATYARVSYATARRRLAALEQRCVIERTQRTRPDGGASVYDYRLIRPPDEGAPALNLSGGARSPGRADPSAHQGERAELPPLEQPRENEPLSRESEVLAAGFDRFWSAWPDKRNKGAARKVWPAAVRKAGGMDLIVAGAERFRDDPNLSPRYTPHASTWLTGERWSDPPLAARGGGQPARRKILEDRDQPEGRIQL